MKFLKAGLVVIVVLVVLGVYVSLRPVRYEHRGLKYVEQRNGLTCSYSPHDNWEYLPLICRDTALVRRENGRE